MLLLSGCTFLSQYMTFKVLYPNDAVSYTTVFHTSRSLTQSLLHIPLQLGYEDAMNGLHGHMCECTCRKQGCRGLIIIVILLRPFGLNN